jgi:hypothetical protein
VAGLLAHESITTTADVYTSWDEEQLTVSLEAALKSESFGQMAEKPKRIGPFRPGRTEQLFRPRRFLD